MEETKSPDTNSQFLSLIVMLATACWQQMGKIQNPVSGELERELNHAKMTLDLLIMLRGKTSGNLTSEEEKVIDNTISDLQLSFADEVEKNKQQHPIN